MGILLIMMAHLFGDFILQNDWMARHKKESSFVCCIHVVVYMIPFMICGLNWWQLSIIAIQHFAQDRGKFVVWFLNSTGKTDFAKAPMAPWSIIVVDNIFHLGTITAVLYVGV